MIVLKFYKFVFLKYKEVLKIILSTEYELQLKIQLLLLRKTIRPAVICQMKDEQLFCYQGTF